MHKAFHGSIWALFLKKEACLKNCHEHLKFTGHYWFKHASYVHEDRCSNLSSCPSLHSIMHIWLHGLKKNCAFISNFGCSVDGCFYMHFTQQKHTVSEVVNGKNCHYTRLASFSESHSWEHHILGILMLHVRIKCTLLLSHIQNSHSSIHTFPSVYHHSPF